MDALTPKLLPWPTALVPALRIVWSRTLFCGESAPVGRPRAVSLFLLLIVPALLLYPRLDFRLFEPDEGRYAEIPREMLQRGEWVVPHLQGEPYLDKPPLLYWLVMLSYQVCGVHDWSARLVPALAVHGCILACYLFGCRMLGERRALRGTLLLTVMPGMIGVGRLLTLDGLLTLWITLGLLAGFRWLQPDRPRWAFAVWTLACGLGVLTKGPIAVVLVVGPMLAWRWLHPERRIVIGWRTWLAFAAGIMLVNVPWYVMICLREPEFAGYFFWRHNLQRFFAPFDHVEPVWYYLPILAAGLLPATFFVVPAVRSLLSGKETIARRRSAELSYCLIAASCCVLFFSLSGSKLPTYILPAFPMLALALGVLLEPKQGLFTRRQWIGGAIWLAILISAQAIVLPAYAHERSPLRDAEVVRQHCGDPNVTVVCYPRNVDSVSFYLQRDDLRSTRSKFTNDLIIDCLSRPRTVVLFTHRHSQEAFSHALPKELKLTPLADFRGPRYGPIIDSVLGGSPWGLCTIAAVEQRDVLR